MILMRDISTASIWCEMNAIEFCTKEEAIEFPTQKTRGQKVFPKLDNIKHDDENNLLRYLYLRNKTFVNAHLIKNGLADVGVAKDYKYKSNFVDYSRLT
jgi:endonuclease YncB( thermonuclease family)